QRVAASQLPAPGDLITGFRRYDMRLLVRPHRLCCGGQIVEERIATEEVDSVVPHPPVGEAEAALDELRIRRLRLAVVGARPAELAEHRPALRQVQVEAVGRKPLPAVDVAAIVAELALEAEAPAELLDRELHRHRIASDRAGGRVGDIALLV